MRAGRSCLFNGFLCTTIACGSLLIGNGAAAEKFEADSSDPVAVRCERVFDRADDPSVGIDLRKLETAEALDACGAAARREPARPRYQHLYGMALVAAKRYAEAVEPLTAADRGGHGFAPVLLGSLYYDGRGVPRDRDKAAALFRRAGERGETEGWVALGQHFLQSNPPDYRAAFDAFDRGARLGSTHAATYLGAIYLYGLSGAKDEKRGLALLKQAANAGDPLAQMNLGIAYYQGIGVAQDIGEAAQLLKHPADLGYSQAQALMGTMYKRGEGIARNETEAMAWLRKAAAQSDPYGMAQLGIMLKEAEKYAEATSWLDKAASAGVAEAQRNLAGMYRYGAYRDFGGPAEDKQAAAKWYSAAAAQGDAIAKRILGRMYETGEGVPRDVATARKLYMEIIANNPDQADLARASVKGLDKTLAASSSAAKTTAAATQGATSGQPGNYWPDTPDDPFGGNGGFIRPAPSASASAQQGASQSGKSSPGQNCGKTDCGARRPVLSSKDVFPEDQYERRDMRPAQRPAKLSQEQQFVGTGLGIIFGLWALGVPNPGYSSDASTPPLPYGCKGPGAWSRC